MYGLGISLVKYEKRTNTIVLQLLFISGKMSEKKPMRTFRHGLSLYKKNYSGRKLRYNIDTRFLQEKVG